MLEGGAIFFLILQGLGLEAIDEDLEVVYQICFVDFDEEYSPEW